MQVSGIDPLVGEGLLFEKLLREQGVETKLDYYRVRQTYSFFYTYSVLTSGARICHTPFITSSS
jgi:hypothetical protein